MNKGGQVIKPVLPNEPKIERSEIPTLRRDKAKISRIPLWQEMQNKPKILRFQPKNKGHQKSKPNWNPEMMKCETKPNDRLNLSSRTTIRDPEAELPNKAKYPLFQSKIKDSLKTKPKN